MYTALNRYKSFWTKSLDQLVRSRPNLYRMARVTDDPKDKNNQKDMDKIVKKTAEVNRKKGQMTCQSNLQRANTNALGHLYKCMVASEVAGDKNTQAGELSKKSFTQYMNKSLDGDWLQEITTFKTEREIRRAVERAMGQAKP